MLTESLDHPPDGARDLLLQEPVAVREAKRWSMQVWRRPRRWQCSRAEPLGGRRRDVQQLPGVQRPLYPPAGSWRTPASRRRRDGAPQGDHPHRGGGLRQAAAHVVRVGERPEGRGLSLPSSVTACRRAAPAPWAVPECAWIFQINRSYGNLQISGSACAYLAGSSILRLL